MPDAARFLTLASGLRLAWNEYGAPDGEPVFFCHGWPGSRQQAARLDAAAKQFGFRLLSPDRPGIALSDRPATRSLRDWPALLEEVCALLGVGRFRIVGVSGGGPYALISAWKFPDRVISAATVCGAPPIAEMRDRSLLSPVYRKLLALYESRPGTVRLLFRVMRPFVRLPFPRPLLPFVLKMLGGADANALSDPAIFEICHNTFREAWDGSADGVFDDAQVYAQPWGFDPEEIRVPVTVWHGRDDRNFRWPLAEALAARIPGARLHIVENEGHYSLPFGQAHAILGELRKSATDAP